VNANGLEILLRVKQGMAFHFWAITFFDSPKLLIFLGGKIGSYFLPLHFSSLQMLKLEPN